MLTHRGLTNNARLAADAIGMRAGEAAVNPMPLFHIAGCGLLTLGLVQSTGTHVLMPHFDPGLRWSSPRPTAARASAACRPCCGRCSPTQPRPA